MMHESDQQAVMHHMNGDSITMYLLRGELEFVEYTHFGITEHICGPDAMEFIRLISKKADDEG